MSTLERQTREKGPIERLREIEERTGNIDEESRISGRSYMTCLKGHLDQFRSQLNKPETQRELGDDFLEIRAGLSELWERVLNLSYTKYRLTVPPSHVRKGLLDDLRDLVPKSRHRRV